LKRNLLTLGAIVFLAACGGGESKTPATTTAATTATDSAAAAAPVADLAKGKTLFDGTCAACHGPLGKGDGPGAASLNPKPRDFSNKEYMVKLTDTEIRNTIKYGGAIKGMPQMPSHPQFNDTDLAALVAYVRSLSPQ
jgi:mono/diheme cytochrome c family protein